MRKVYAERLSILLEEARAKLAGLLSISNVEAGLQTVGWLAKGIDAESATTAAARLNVGVTPLSRYIHDRALPQGLQLGFAAIDPKEISRGVRALALALETALGTAAPRP
jgi:GntR family transcriptional regulator / MocR family aminotransferase